MVFNIHALDEADQFGELPEGVLGAYIDELMELFADSPEGQARLAADPEMGFWARQLVEHGQIYQGATPPHMEVGDVEELLAEIFPEKLTMWSADEALDALPELIAFWEYLGREYQLSHAQDILGYLRSVEPETFRGWMMDKSRFGIAKSFAMAALEAGVDLTDTDAMNGFMAEYNARLLASQSPGLGLSPVPDDLDDLEALFAPGLPFPSRSAAPAPKGSHAGKAKKQRKMAAASRKKNRRRK